MEASELVEVTIESIRTSQLTLHRIVVLGEQGGERLLPIWIGPFEADAIQMRQLFLNLICNALKFQPPGATPVVSIRGRVIPPTGAPGQTTMLSRAQAEMTAPAEDWICEVTVQDNGIGFEEKYLDKIFAVFQRLHGRQEYEGTGIGLAVCRRILERHGGKITAQSKLGEGATFVFHLPVRQKQLAPGPA